MKRLLVVFSIVTLSSTLHAQRWQWPERAQNLKVLPGTTTAEDLQRAMQNFTAPLGVRCSFCHVGEEGKDLSEYDFAADDKPEKEKARMMIRMVQAINREYLAKLPGRSSASMEVSCLTCHRGNSIPILLEDKLKDTYDHYGIDSTVSQYRALRGQFYGGFTYNFGKRTLLRLADKIMQDSAKSPDAVAVVKLNIELYPEFGLSYVHLANIYESLGDVQAAIENYQQAIRLDPMDEGLKRQLEKLQGLK